MDSHVKSPPLHKMTKHMPLACEQNVLATCRQNVTLKSADDAQGPQQGSTAPAIAHCSPVISGGAAVCASTGGGPMGSMAPVVTAPSSAEDLHVS